MWWWQTTACAHMHTHHLQEYYNRQNSNFCFNFSPCILSAFILSLHNPTLPHSFLSRSLSDRVRCHYLKDREMFRCAVNCCLFPITKVLFSLTFWVAVSFLLPFPLPPFLLSIFQKENGQFCHNLFWWRGKLPNYLLNHFESFWRRCWFPPVIKYWLASNFTAIFSWIFSLTKHAGHILILHLVLNSGFVFCILYAIRLQY